MIDNLEEVNDIEDKIIFDFGMEEKFDRPNLTLFIIYKKYIINIRLHMVIVNGIM